jgi:hypothetical protein
MFARELEIIDEEDMTDIIFAVLREVLRDAIPIPIPFESALNL